MNESAGTPSGGFVLKRAQGRVIGIKKIINIIE